MKAVTAIIIVSVTGVSACVTLNPIDTCRFSSKTPLYDFSPDALTFLLASPRYSAIEKPFLVLYDPDGNPVVKIDLVARKDTEEWPESYIGQRCVEVEWREYNLSVDSDDWSSYWNAAIDGGFSVGVALPGLEGPVRLHAIGFAFIDSSTRKSSASCGCLQQ